MNMFLQKDDGSGRRIYDDAVSLTEFIIMVISLVLAFTVLMFYCCRLWKQNLYARQNRDDEEALLDPKTSNNNPRVKIVHHQLPSCSKIVLMPDGGLNCGVDDKYLGCKVSKSKENLIAGFGFSLASSVKNQSLQNGELIIYDDIDSEIEVASVSAKSYFSWLSDNDSELFKPAENFDANQADFLP